MIVEALLRQHSTTLHTFETDPTEAVLVLRKL
jgi:hypothetical protein